VRLNPVRRLGRPGLTLGTFLGAQSQRIFEWPLATPGRQHIHSKIDSAELAARHQTRRKGRPYRLVLTKTDELFTHAANAHHKAETGLAWLAEGTALGPAVVTSMM
jgi:hypothetical protein